MTQLTKADDFNVVLSKALDKTESNINPLIFKYREKIVELQRDLDLARIELDKKDAWIENCKHAMCDESIPRSSADYARWEDNLESLFNEREAYNNHELKNKRSALDNNKLILELLNGIVKNITSLRGMKEIKNQYSSWWWRVVDFQDEPKTSKSKKEEVSRQTNEVCRKTIC